MPSPGDLPNPGTEPRSPTLQVDSLLSEPPGDLLNPGNEPGSPTLQAGSLLAELPGKPQFWVTKHLQPTYGTAGAIISRFLLRSVCRRR